MILSYSLLVGSALCLMWTDVRKQTIPLWALLLFIMASVLHQLYEPNSEGLWVAGLLLLLFLGCQSIYYFFTRKLAIGWGDVLLVPFCGFWLYFHELPSFLLGTGLVALLMGLLWRYKWGLRTFPFVPALLLGLGIVFLIRCFLIKNGI